MLLVLVRIVKAMIRLAVAVAGLRSKDLMTIAMMTDGWCDQCGCADVLMAAEVCKGGEVLLQS